MGRIVQLSIITLTGITGAVLGGLLLRAPEEQTGAREPKRAQAGEREVVGRLARERVQGRGIDRSASPAEPDSEPEPDSESDFAAIAARERELSEGRAATIDAAAALERVDPLWAAAMERQLTEGFAAHAPAGSRLLSATCKTTLCVAKIDHPPEIDDPTGLNWPTILSLSRGFLVHHEPGTDGRPRTVAYLARDGHRLPN